MGCDEVRELLALYAGGDGSEEDRPGVEVHLALCAGCARELDQHREVRAALALLGSLPLPPAASKAVWTAVRKEVFPRRSWRTELLRYAAVLLLGLGIGAAAYVAVPHPSSQLRATGGGPRLEAQPAGGLLLEPRRPAPERHHLPLVEAVPVSGEREF